MIPQPMRGATMPYDPRGKVRTWGNSARGSASERGAFPMAAAAALNAVGERYLALVRARPFAAPASIGFVIAAAGDVASQLGVEGRDAAQWDARRTADMGAIRALVMAPMLQLYFPALARAVPGTSWRAVLARVAADQAVGSPVTIVLTFTAAAALQGRLAELPARLAGQGPATWLNGASYWPLVHCVNFRFVPPGVQPLVAHVMSVPWNAVLSYRANAALPPAAGAAAAAAPDGGAGAGPPARL